MATYNPLKIQQHKLAEQQAELERQIAAVLAREKAAGIQRIRELMAQFGIAAAELALKPGKSRRPGKTKSKSAGPSAARYRDPASGATWTGKGRRPAWFVQWLAQGRPLTELTL
jgi:DNA-binding protein H-NS